MCTSRMLSSIIFKSSIRLAAFSNWGQAGSGPGEFLIPSGVAVSSDNRIFVADAYNCRIQVFKYVGKNENRNPKSKYRDAFKIRSLGRRLARQNRRPDSWISVIGIYFGFRISDFGFAPRPRFSGMFFDTLGAHHRRLETRFVGRRPRAR